MIMPQINSKTMVQFNYLVEVAEKTWIASFGSKALISIGVLVGSILAEIYLFIEPITSLIMLTVWLVMADFITGIIACKFPKDKTQKVEIESTKMGRSIAKMLMYAISIIAWHGIGKVLIPSVEMAYFACVYISFTEIQSLDENGVKILGFSIFDKIKDKVKMLKK